MDFLANIQPELPHPAQCFEGYEPDLQLGQSVQSPGRNAHRRMPRQKPVETRLPQVVFISSALVVIASHLLQ
jgi:hypothetical protein